MVMGRLQREKGKRGERAAAKAIMEHLGVSARRGRQFSGSPDSPDVVADLPGVHIEVKNTEKLSLYAAMDQAYNDSRGADIPLLLHKRNNKEWLAVVPLRLLKKLALSIVASTNLFTEGSDDSCGDSISLGSGHNQQDAGRPCDCTANMQGNGRVRARGKQRAFAPIAICPGEDGPEVVRGRNRKRL